MSATAAPALSGSATQADPARPSSLQSSWVARLTGVLEEMAWLDRAGGLAAGLATPLTRRQRLLDVLLGRPLGHALHPALTDLPIGLWAGTVICDAVGEDTAAGVLGAAGCAAAVATAITGIADWTVSDGRERRLGLLHGLVNSAGLALELTALGARVAGRRGAARRLSVTGLGVGAAAAWVGGELVFGRGLRVDHTAWTAGPQEWTAVLDAGELAEGAIRGVSVEGRQVLLHRSQGTVHAMEDACSHAGGPLCEGEVVAPGVIACPWHGSRFSLEDGSVVRGPATHPQPRLMTRIRDGHVEVRGRAG